MKLQNLFYALAIVALAIVSCKKESTPDPDGVTLSKTTLSLKVAQIDSIQANVTPPEASPVVTWKSSDTTIAKVNARGVITAVKIGVDTITATAQGGKFSAKAVVNVVPESFTVSGSVSGVWKRGNTYTVSSHINIPKDLSLTIEEGVTVIFSDTSNHTEVIINGNLYCKGTAQYPIKFTVSENQRTNANIMKGLWGGFICSKTCQEVLFTYTTIEYQCAVIKSTSPSVPAGLYKATAGEFDPAIYFSNVTGKLVVDHCRISYNQDDVTYLEGGNIIFMYNTFFSSGKNGGDVMNFKSGTTADCAFNLVYSGNTNAFKLSNSGNRTPQATIIGYNNTIVNCGWRRPDVKGGSIWLESGVIAKLYNNLLANDRFGIKNSKGAADASSVYDYTFYYANSATGLAQFQSTTTDVVRGAHDVAGTTVGGNDPLFYNFPITTDAQTNYVFDSAWDFHLKSGSPALTGANTSFTRNFGTTGITINGVTYTSPAPASYFGAFGLK